MTEVKTKRNRTRRSYAEKGLSIALPSIICICPKCEETHVMKLKWIGRGIPKKFCKACEGRIGRLKGLPDDVIGYKMNEPKGGESFE